MNGLKPKIQRISVVALLCVLCICLSFAIFMRITDKPNNVNSQNYTPPKKEAVKINPVNEDEKPIKEVEVAEVIPEPKVESTPKPNEIQLTKIPEKPKPPKKSDVAEGDTDWKPNNVDLTNPNKKPDDTVTADRPPKPTGSQPKGAETNKNGELYVPGFGWMKSSGPNVGEKSDSNGDWNKQIGSMN
jgi:hypothetical protein